MVRARLPLVAPIIGDCYPATGLQINLGIQKTEVSGQNHKLPHIEFWTLSMGKIQLPGRWASMPSYWKPNPANQS